MKERNISLSQARQTLASLPELFSAECPSITITYKNRPLMSVMSYETHQSLLQTIDSLQTLLQILGTNELVEQVLQKKKERACVPDTSHHISWEEFKEEFGWE